jgi:CheY-like chemotaxis protein
MMSSRSADRTSPLQTSYRTPVSSDTQGELRAPGAWPRPADQPSTVGGYRLLRKIASGTFGRVFLAEDPANGRQVAVKVLRSQWARDTGVLELFRHEARLGLGLRHPNIVQVLDAGQDTRSGQHYIVMEFVGGGDVRGLLSRVGRLAPSDALRLLDETTAGLAFAHSRGALHRDLKPSNILLTARGEPKLVDFGLGLLRGAGDDETARAQRTLDYAGLEEATGVTPGDPRSDIYFLGCVFYELLTGRPPLRPTEDRLARTRRERFEGVQPLRAEEAGGSLQVARLAEAMLSLDPARRFQTVAQLHSAVREARAAAEQGNAPPPTVYIVESTAEFQDVLRRKLRRAGYRVLLAGDPERAVERFAQAGFDALLVNAATGGSEALRAVRRVLELARTRGTSCRAIVLLDHDQEAIGRSLVTDPLLAESASVLFLPLKVHDVMSRLRQLFGTMTGAAPKFGRRAR